MNTTPNHFSKDLEAERLDKIAGYFHEEAGFEKVLLKYRIQSVRPHLKGRRLLDVGCGFGYLCRVGADLFEIVVGIDGSHKKIIKAKQKNAGSNITYIETLFEDFKPKQQFDTITATAILEHVEDAIGFLKHCRELLSSNGRIIITVLNALGLHKRIGKHLGLIQDFYTLTPEDLKRGHRRIYDRQRLINDLTAALLKASHIEGILLKPLSDHQMEGWDIKICDALYEIGKELPDYCSSILAVAERA